MPRKPAVRLTRPRRSLSGGRYSGTTETDPLNQFVLAFLGITSFEHNVVMCLAILNEGVVNVAQSCSFSPRMCLATISWRSIMSLMVNSSLLRVLGCDFVA